MSKKSAFIAAALLAVGLASTSAHAKDVYWSVGVNAPLDGVGHIGTVVSNYPSRGPVVVQSPDYYPVYQPVYQQPVRVYRPAPVVYYPAPVVYEPYRYRHHPRWDRRDYRRGEWRDDRGGHHHHHGR
jgi:hypothetical protein